MKKHIKKLVKHRRYASWRKRKKMQMPLAFASLFALIMVIYGISLIFAATSAIFSLTPATQTATAGQTKSVVISLNPNGNEINGGTVRVNYDTARLTFSKFTPVNSPYTISGQTNGAGFYSFNFYSYSDIEQNATLGTLEFQIKSVTATAQTPLTFAPTTRSYEGRPWSPDYYTSQLNNASITVQFVPPPKPVVTVVLTPTSVAYNGSTTVSWSATNSPTSCSNNFGGAAAASGSLKINNLTANRTFTVTCANAGGSTSSSKTVTVAAKPGTPPTTPGGGNSSTPTPSSSGGGPEAVPVPPTEETNSEENAANPDESLDQIPTEAAVAKKSSPVKAIAAIVGGLAILGGCAYMYFVRLKPHSRLPKATNLKGSLFDDSKPTKAAAAAAGSLAAKKKDSEPDQAAAEAEGELVISHEDQASPLAEEQPVEADNQPQPPEFADQTFEDQPEEPLPSESETQVEDSQHEEITENVPAPDVPPVPVENTEPELSPADQIAQAALASIAAHKGPSFQEVVAKDAAVHMPPPPEPQWQKTVVHKKSPKEEPKDMFELAMEDPENFGSTQLAESYGEEVDKKYDATKK